MSQNEATRSPDATVALHKLLRKEKSTHLLLRQDTLIRGTFCPHRIFLNELCLQPGLL